MFSLTVNSPKPLSLSTPFLPTHPHPLPSITHKPNLNPKPITALIIPPSSGQQQQYSTQQQQQQQLYQPFRPPPPLLPPKFRNLDTNSKLEVLANRLGLWYEYAPLIPSLTREGFTPSTLEEITGLTGVDQNRLVVAAQVRDSLVESAALDEETLSYFESGGAELLYEIRLLSARQRADAATFLVKNGFDAKQAQDLARAIKDYPRRRVEYGWDKFHGDSPGDCLAFMYFRLAQEYAAAASEDLRRSSMEKALEVAESESARNLLVMELEGNEVAKESVKDDGVTVPLVRMKLGEVAESTIVVVLPVCKAEGRDVEVEAAPWECGGVGDFGIVEAEKDWRRWVVLPGWQPIAGLERGGVAVSFKSGNFLPWREKSKYKQEPVLVVADRGRTEVASEDGFYLVVDGGNGSNEEGLKVERGSTLKKRGVEQSLGIVLIVVRPPKWENEDQLGEEDWD
ncbi:rubisco accumulation factor 1.2, chloroplastic [Nicotiana tabacum]|uniref:Rubisco accumulation factor 1.2, chloroplastic n=1 Tax=Nicotiana tabacum TaxID=4097 RepID=A0A1S4BJ58_TOBAC|nr:PREDICTED: rubisco accumulation factor 2, chloroplastic-like [Nicotiana tabacum]